MLRWEKSKCKHTPTNFYGNFWSKLFDKNQYIGKSEILLIEFSDDLVKKGSKITFRIIWKTKYSADLN